MVMTQVMTVTMVLTLPLLGEEILCPGPLPPSVILQCVVGPLQTLHISEKAPVAWFVVLILRTIIAIIHRAVKRLHLLLVLLVLPVYWTRAS